MASFQFSISYSQIAAFNADLDSPFNDWTDRHVAQGFAWRPQSVSFKTLVESGPAAVEVNVLDEIPTFDAIRVISVPFHCPEGGTIEIASIADSAVTNVPPGDYQLVFQTGFQGEDCWCRLSFVSHSVTNAEILIWDGTEQPEEPLWMEAEPA